jgi:hypothetical protein
MTVDDVRLAVRSWDASSCEPGAGTGPRPGFDAGERLPARHEGDRVATPTPDAATASEGAQW